MQHFDGLTTRSVLFQPPFLKVCCGACSNSNQQWSLPNSTNGRLGLPNLHSTLDHDGNADSNRSGGKKFLWQIVLGNLGGNAALVSCFLVHCLHELLWKEASQIKWNLMEYIICKAQKTSGYVGHSKSVLLTWTKGKLIIHTIELAFCKDMQYLNTYCTEILGKKLFNPSTRSH